ncbi:MAG: lactonase family protein [Chloroflexota bacterium]
MTTPQPPEGETLLYIGTYTRGDSEGIYVYRMDNRTGRLSYHSKATGIENPSYLALHPRNTFLYSVAEVADHNGQKTGAVSAYSLTREGELVDLNTQPSQGPGPCHVTVDRQGHNVYVANYQGGSVGVLPIQSDGSLGEPTDFHQHEGSSVNPQRQNEPHAHSVNLDQVDRFAFVADLGMDKVMIYRVDLQAGKLTPNNPPHVDVHPGAGPRHFDFHPNGRLAYLINEIDSTITAFRYDPQRGALEEIQTLSTLPEGFNDSNTTADVHVHPSGRFVYGSNRGHDSIAIFGLDDDGHMTPLGHEPTQGQTPRNFAIDPSGVFLLAENQNSSTIVTFSINQTTGGLEPTGDVAEVPNPVCIKMIR